MATGLRRGSLIAMLLALLGHARAQNLVPNGDLEQFTACPTYVAQLEYASHWINPSAWLPGMATPDYLNTCAPYPVSVPISNFGDQVPLSANGYMGLVTYYTPQPDFREYAEVQLLSPLVAGEHYYFRMYVSRGDNCNTAIDHLGVHFSDTAIVNIPGHGPLPVVPQLVNTTGLLADEYNWTQITGLYQAHGGEEYLVIGNFRDDASSDVVLVGAAGNYQSAYYFIDEVMLEHWGGSTGLNGGLSHGSGLVPDPVIDHARFIAEPMEPALMVVHDITGRRTFQRQVGRDGAVDLSALPAGVYAYGLQGSSVILATGRFVKQ